MTTTAGNDGSLYIGSTIMAELKSWTVTEEATVVDDSALGDIADTHIAGKFTKRWTAEAEVMWDSTDANGQEACTIGASVTLNLYPAGNTTGKKYKTGTASITSVGVAVSRGPTVSRTLRFQGNGALAQAT